jgi:hypothetical protein
MRRRTPVIIIVVAIVFLQVLEKDAIILYHCRSKTLVTNSAIKSGLIGPMVFTPHIEEVFHVGCRLAR